MPTKNRRKKKRKGHYIRGEYTSTKNLQVCKYRSGWEAKFMVYLDSSPEVVSWTYEQTIIEYISNIRSKKVRKYYPDFTVKYRDGHAEVIEVKPKRKLEHITVKKKAAAARVWCTEHDMIYRLITEVELKELGLL